MAAILKTKIQSIYKLFFSTKLLSLITFNLKYETKHIYDRFKSFNLGDFNFCHNLQFEVWHDHICFELQNQFLGILQPYKFSAL